MWLMDANVSLSSIHSFQPTQPNEQSKIDSSGMLDNEKKREKRGPLITYITISIGKLCMKWRVAVWHVAVVPNKNSWMRKNEIVNYFNEQLLLFGISNWEQQ